MKEWFLLHEKTAYRTVNAGLLVCLVLFGAERFLGIGEPGGEHFIVAFIVLGILTAVNHMTVRGRILCLSVLFLLLCAGAAAGPAGSPDFWQSFFPWLVGKGTAPQEWKIWYGLLQTALLAAVCYLVQILFEKIPALKTGAAFFLTGVLVSCLLFRWEWNRPGMALMLCFLLLTWEEWVQGHWEKKRVRRNGFRTHTFWILPFLALYLVLLLLMPAPEKPYDWMWVKTVYRQLRESIHTYTQNRKWGNREGFCMAFTGFSQEGILGGDLRESAREIMRVQVRPPFGGHLYLTGMVYDTFDGREWSRTQQDSADMVFLDTAQLLYAVRNYDSRCQIDYLKEIKVNIRYEDFSTGYVFAPLKVWNLEAGGSDKRGQGEILDDTCEYGTLRWNGQKGYGTEYVLRYFGMNAGQPQFDLFLEEAGKTNDVNEEVWKEVMKEWERRGGQAFTIQDREDCRKQIYELYLGNTGSLSAEAKSFLGQIMEGTETDVEKLKALESALSGFVYTLTPGELPESVKDAGDFLDYFLLESRQGYCTYFATAFVLLARAEGIPARYVQGYCVPIGEQGEASVYSDMAHAWPEAYLEGVGWIPFEPTPGYGNRRYNPWKLRQAAEDSALEWDLESDLETEIVEEETYTGDGENPEETDAGAENAPGYFWRPFCFVLLAVLSVCGILLTVDNALWKYRYGKMTPDKKLRAEVFRNLRVLSCFGLKRATWETLKEFRERAGHLADRYGEEKALSIRFMEDYERVVYGGQPAGEYMIKEAMKEREGLLELLKQEKRWVWLYCRIRLYLERYRF